MPSIRNSRLAYAARTSAKRRVACGSVSVCTQGGAEHCAKAMHPRMHLAVAHPEAPAYYLQQGGGLAVEKDAEEFGLARASVSFPSTAYGSVSALWRLLVCLLVLFPGECKRREQAFERFPVDPCTRS